MCIRDSSNTKLTLINCTVIRNKASDGGAIRFDDDAQFVSCLLYTSPAHETVLDLVCRLLLEKKKKIIKERRIIILSNQETNFSTTIV